MDSFLFEVAWAFAEDLDLFNKLYIAANIGVTYA